MEPIIIDSWKNFIRIVDHLDIGPITEYAYMYRGQSKEKWKLTPSFYRHLDKIQCSAKKLLSLENKAMEKFKMQAHQFKVLDAPTVLDWWATMQHHGAPTRLLDWTSSPYVATYFACVNHSTEDGAIWILHVDSLNKSSINIDKSFLNFEGSLPSEIEEFNRKFTSPDSLKCVRPFELPFKSNRMMAQQSLFTFCFNISENQHEILSESLSEPKSKIIFQKLIIPQKQKIKFLKKLRSMNITASSLFPGIDGLGRSVSEFLHISSMELAEK